MADEILTSPGEPVSPPAEQSDHPKVVYAPDVPSRNEAIQDTFKAGLGLTALGTEDATDYAREREVQDKFLAGEDLSPAQMREWHERTNTALQRAIDAQARARGEVPPSEQPSQELPESLYIAPDHPQYEQIIEANKARFSEYFDDPTRIGDQLTAAEHKKAVTDWILTYDPKQVLIGHFMASPLGPQMMESLEGQPQVIQYLANLPPAIRAKEMGKLEGYVAAKQEAAAQNSYASREPEPRRVTQAPPPIRSPRGGAMPPKDFYQLAGKSSDVTDYVRARRLQEARRDD